MTQRSFIIASIAGLAFLVIAQAAPAGSLAKFVPLHTTSDLRGTLKFYPSDGSHPFKCKVRLVLFTGKGTGGNGKPPEVEKASGVGCPPNFFFTGLPWAAEPVNNGVTAQLYSFGWTEQGQEGLCNETYQPFSVSEGGIWSATSGCATGRLTSNPPVKIKP
jgi:hypothetical protein